MSEVAVTGEREALRTNMAALRGTQILLRRTSLSCRLIPRRNRVKTKWAATFPSFPATSLALQNFDMSYGEQLGALWPSARISMLCEQKYGALLNNFSETTGQVSDLQMKGAQDFVLCGISTPGSVPRSDRAEADQAEDVLKFSPGIQCFVFPKSDTSRFRPARPDSSGVLGYYLLDAASILPVLALDVQEGHSVLDLCAAPGGKTLALLQTHAIKKLTVNDLSDSRLKRLRRMLQDYIPREIWSENRVDITSCDGRTWGEMGRSTFDRVLVDVPCTTDRHSVLEEENNIFKRSRTKERQRLPLLQTQLLVAGMEAARPGGVVVYSTCTLSQLQNECVVEQALRVAQEELDIGVQVEDVGPLSHIFSTTFCFAPDRRLGALVVPHLTANFGPTYFCKLQRVH
uniref:5-cytosine rRNA methyltransferase NSUN4 n=1 Tax=Paramormyrops kingsleyae TaxID=1676925 RepID=A0A3B3S7E7_9TELE|nr:5-methylcytosine rRNA methyltransferase NSUN4 [Paramormyrops kingsleyae]